MPALTQKGQVTMPKNIRQFLGLHTGDDVEFVVKQGRVEVRKAAEEHVSFYGVLSVAPRPTLARSQDDTELMDTLLDDDDRIRGQS